MKQSSPTRTLIRPITETAEQVRHQVTQESHATNTDADVSEALDYKREFFTIFNKTTNEMSFVKGQNGAKMNAGDIEVSEVIKKEFDRLTKKTTRNEISSWTILLMRRWHNVPLRPMGGIWFIGDDFTEEVRKLEAVYADIGSKLFMHPVVNTEEWRTDMSSCVDRDMEQDVKNLTADLDEILADAKAQGGQIKSAVLDTRLRSFKALVSKTEMYERLLDYTSKKIRSDVDALNAKVQSVLMGKVKGLVAVAPKKEQVDADKAKRAAERAKKAAERAEAAMKKAEEMKKKAAELAGEAKEAEESEAVPPVEDENVSDDDGESAEDKAELDAVKEKRAKAAKKAAATRAAKKAEAKKNETSEAKTTESDKAPF